MAHSETQLCDLASEWKVDLLSRVLPLWMNHSLDFENGGYYTCFDGDGNRYDDNKYMWFNERQVSQGNACLAIAPPSD